MAHCVVPEAEALLDKEFPVLDKGFVRLVDYLGGDARIVQAARVSYGEGTKTVREDSALIDHLLRNSHTSPFEQVVLAFHVKLPVFVARQWLRHRTARLNEISGRYSVLRGEFYVPRAEDVAFQSADNRQGRAEEAAPPEFAEKVRASLERGQRDAYHTYGELIQSGLSREIARVCLPLSVYTEMYWQIDLHNLFHFLRLRLDLHAQKEIREYAEVLLRIARAVAPLATASFENHRLGGILLSRDEADALRVMLGGGKCPLSGKAKERFLAKIERGVQL
ncbi:FAD-dependent thymidylate synthase [Treponema endosymbiont of Eucomonympha sp.]|uniref:FAD-dependent thymidylate synthase n=1 Tax=Treponema endosymbiont of Eucomonympha sp. TaxID=1580831 RepID=UPI000783E67F|nr:FAD-dependent thymidylate synthase [Treponema endosymbiont of Eucomonympha sp.]